MVGGLVDCGWNVCQIHLFVNVAVLLPVATEEVGWSNRNLVYDVCEVYAMGTISARVPDELESEFERYLEDEQLDRSTAIRKLLSESLDQWRREQALEALAEGRVTLSRAAEIAELSVWELAQLAAEHDITWVDDDHLDDDLEAL